MHRVFIKTNFLLSSILPLLLLYLFVNLSTLDAQSKLISELGKTDNIELETNIEQAQIDFMAGHSIDARNKLLQAVKLAPNDFRPHLLLGVYYLSEVNHFQLAEKYLQRSQQLFSDVWGSELDDSIKPEAQMMNSRILGLLAEVKVNLDEYEAALKIINRFEATYDGSWVPSTKAWVLMKLKRVDEGIQTAQLGLLKSHDIGRVLNILGILFSLKNNASLAKQTFTEAIKYEKLLGKYGQISTPLNNLGEVYREIFSDRYAEATWVQALNASEECEHILTSLNMAILQIDELRLIQAERTLKDFEACFARFPHRSDTEHRALLALGYGKIALRMGKPLDAAKFFHQALARKQWFGKIGTNQNDVQLASLIGLSQSYQAYAAILKNKPTVNIFAKLDNYLHSIYYQLKGDTRMREAQKWALKELDNFEDLYIRHTDAMIEYPTLGDLTKSLPTASIKKRANSIIKNEQRNEAKAYYMLYQAANLAYHGDKQEALAILEQLANSFRDFDRLVLAEILRYKIIIQEELLATQADENLQQQLVDQKELLFSYSPAYLAYFEISLPVTIKISAVEEKNGKLTQIRELLLAHGFNSAPRHSKCNYLLEIEDISAKKNTHQISISLKNSSEGKLIAAEEVTLSSDNNSIIQSVDNFINKVFIHLSDPPAEPLPNVSFEENH